MLGQHCHGSPGWEYELAGEQPVGDATHRVDIGAVIDRALAGDRFGIQIGGSADDGTFACEIWIGLVVLVVGFSLPRLLDAGHKTTGVVLAVTFMCAVALVVIAGMKEPERKAADEAKHKAKWERPFD